MPRIELEIPEWAIGRNITVYAGTELLSYTSFVRKKKRINGRLDIEEYYTPMKIKDGRCNGCGQCCETAGSPFSEKIYIDILNRLNNWEFKETGRCPLLGDDGCTLGTDIPFGCARSDCSHFDKCTESFIQLEVIN